MTFWQWLGIGFGAVAVFELLFLMVCAWIPLMLYKRKVRRSHEQQTER